MSKLPGEERPHREARLSSPFWARGGHLQTILGHLLRSDSELKDGEDVNVTLPDGDELAGHLLVGSSDTVVYLFHGLGGSIESGYMIRTAKLCHRLGHSVFRFNHRGCGRGRFLTHRNTYHSGRAEDLAEAIAYGRKRFPDKKHIAIGYSLSGNALLLLQAEQRGKTLPDAAIAVNAPIHLADASERLNQGLNRLYGFRFVQDCRRDLAIKKKKGWIEAGRDISPFASIGEFDDKVTAPLSGFQGKNHYYSVCSALQYLEKIKTPTLLITSQDDPFVAVEHYLNAKLSLTTRLIVTDTGGHMGYLGQGAKFWKTDHWFESQLGIWIQELKALIETSALESRI